MKYDKNVIYDKEKALSRSNLLQTVLDLNKKNKINQGETMKKKSD
jgi:hypothetical protein